MASWFGRIVYILEVIERGGELIFFDVTWARNRLLAACTYPAAGYSIGQHAFVSAGRYTAGRIGGADLFKGVAGGGCESNIHGDHGRTEQRFTRTEEMPMPAPAIDNYRPFNSTCSDRRAHSHRTGYACRPVREKVTRLIARMLNKHEVCNRPGHADGGHDDE